MYIETVDKVKLYVEKHGDGFPLVFVHEFGGDYRGWQPQVNYFSRRYKCITFNARGYPPSDVPKEESCYSQDIAVQDLFDLLNQLSIEKAHLVGLSMGGFTVLHFGMRYPDRVKSLVIAGAGYGAEKQHEQFFRELSNNVADKFTALGSEEYSHTYGKAASRIPFLLKDPKGWNDFRKRLGEHSKIGAGLTMRGVQAKRPSIYDLEEELRVIQVPTLIVVGDEDDHCLNPGFFMKRSITTSGLLILPKTGHTINLEEPDFFNFSLSNFFAQVENNKWNSRDPRSNPLEIMKT